MKLWQWAYDADDMTRCGRVKSITKYNVILCRGNGRYWQVDKRKARNGKPNAKFIEQSKTSARARKKAEVV